MGIAHLTIVQFRERIHRFRQRYVDDWREWLITGPSARAEQLGIIMRRWQACRPNTMRRTRAENRHDPPFLEDLIEQAEHYLQVLNDFEIRFADAFTQQNREALGELWNIFVDLSYGHRARNGLAGVVGISKAVILLTDGRIGPAFDSRVRGELQLGSIENSAQWIAALQLVSQDIKQFEHNNQSTLQEAAPQAFTILRSGRLCDMALGPR
jgi:hypothetical protein